MITGICLQTHQKKHEFYESTKVFFDDMSDGLLQHYMETYKPYDKAGGYAIQEWIGLMGIYRLEGCYYNVNGLAG